MRALLLPFVSLFASCAVPSVIGRLDDRSPPPEFGRPGWVRVCAQVGAWGGGLIGGVASVVVLPVTYPLSLLAGDELAEGGSSEFLLFPAIGGAALGHFFLGAPPDVVDYVFRRAWVDRPDPTNSYELIPLDGFEVPRSDPPTPPAEVPNEAPAAVPEPERR